MRGICQRLRVLRMLMLTVCVMSSLSLMSQGTRVITTTGLNVRSGAGTAHHRIATLPPSDTLEVLDTLGDWLLVRGSFGTGYVHGNYTQPVVDVSQLTTTYHRPARWKFWHWGFSEWFSFLIMAALCVFGFFTCLGILFTLFNVLQVGLTLLLVFVKWFYTLVSLPFMITNALQRYLAKPWFLFFRSNHFSDTTNARLRKVFGILQIPLYVLLAPLRLFNAIFFNLLVHCVFELFDYFLEVFYPSSYKEGADGFLQWLLYLPWRLIKYPLWHGLQTFIESLLWTVVDVFLPTLTLYHGTSPEAAQSIVMSPDRQGWAGRDTGVWNVGAGNFAGNGIYFAPARSTAVHYSAGSLIVCRVTLGRTLDLGLAPNYVYNECGHADALNATRWGLNNGFTTGEWWRADAHWWEYCMYDWQNRYNYSWRIRPLFVLDLETGYIQRISGGMSHWLFRRMVVRDIATSLRQLAN